MNSVCEIPINRHLGLTFDEASDALTLPHTEKVSNAFGSVSFCAQFTLAESASAHFLLHDLGMNLDTDIPTLRKAETRFFKPTNGKSHSQVLSSTHTKEQFQDALTKRDKITLTIEVAVISHAGDKALTGNFSWLVLRRSLK